MLRKLDKDYVWECDYGIRKPIIPVLEKLLEEQNATSLQMVQLFVNNNPYSLEFYIVISYDEPQENHIETMKELMASVGLRYRPDITYDEILTESQYRRFNFFCINNRDEVKGFFNNSGFFIFADKEEFLANGFKINHLGTRMPVFLSHSSKNKKEVEELIPYLNGAGLPVWFDKISIDYGESITEAIEKGIEQAGAVVFWITKEFLESNWCKTERRNFVSRHSADNDLLIISIISDEIDIKSEIPIFLRDIKAFARNRNDDISIIASEILPSLKRYFNNKTVI